MDFWGTLLLDGPRSDDDGYRRPRLADFERILDAAGMAVTRTALERGYLQSATHLRGIWSANRDVPVEEHVRVILATANPRLPARLPSAVMSELVEAYARPALVSPPAVDPAALTVLQELRDQGYTLALVSNTMRTPGVTLRKVLAHYRLLACFAHTTFSDEVGVRKPAPEIFALTLRAVGGKPDTAVHVGDDSVLDVRGARAAGMRVIQVARSSAALPDAIIPGLAGLPAAITQLEGA